MREVARPVTSAVTLVFQESAGIVCDRNVVWTQVQQVAGKAAAGDDEKDEVAVTKGDDEKDEVTR